MKKMRFTAVALAVVLVATSAFTHKGAPKYYKDANGQFQLLPARYHCNASSDICTYDENLQTAETGTFVTP